MSRVIDVSVYIAIFAMVMFTFFMLSGCVPAPKNSQQDDHSPLQFAAVHSYYDYQKFIEEN